MRRLPEFEGYTVDERLREFRKVDHDHLRIEFIPFDSREGRCLLARLRNAQKIAKLRVFRNGTVEFECPECGLIGAAFLCEHYNPYECEEVHEP